MSDTEETYEAAESTPEAFEEVVIRLTSVEAARFRTAARFWEFWHNCKGLLSHLDANDPDEAAVQRGLIVMEAVESWADEEGCNLDGGNASDEDSDDAEAAR